MIKVSDMPDIYQQMFADLDRAETAAFPTGMPSNGFDPMLFRMIYNERFATAEFLIASESSEETQAVLPQITQTMEVVGDETLHLTYDEWVYHVTGWYPKNNKTMSLGTRVRRMNLGWTTLITDGADNDAPVDAYGKYVARHNMGWNKNLIAVEPCFVAFIAGIWEQPNSSTIYGEEDPQGNLAPRSRVLTNHTSKTMLDRGADFDFNLFRNAEAWLADPATTDPLGQLGTGTGHLDSINYWLAGEQRFSRDFDPTTLAVNSGASDQTLTTAGETNEGDEAYICDLNFHVGTAELQGFPDR